MSYDRIWIERSRLPGGWIERSQAEEANKTWEFETTLNRLYAQGHLVVLVAGKNCMFDELFLFECDTDAEEFYNVGYRKWEMFSDDDDDEGCGFQEVSLFRCGCRVATKECAPSAPTELNRAETKGWWEKVGKFTCDVLSEDE